MADGGAAAALSAVDQAHRQLLSQSELQFTLPAVIAPMPPWWAKPLQAVFKFLGPAAPYLAWGALILSVGAILYLIGREMFGIRREGPQMRMRLHAKEAVWAPAPEQARALLADADRLAEQGQFIEAAHLILLRSIEDIQTRRPRMVAVSLTSRDIAALPGLPAAARDTFVHIAQAVELSLFGGRPLDREGFSRCRDAYADFVDAKAWT